MRLLRFLFPAALTVALTLSASHSAFAQGLIWKLPAAEKFTVLYSGTYTETVENAPMTNEKKPQIRRQVIVKSLGKDKGYYQGKEVDCRLMEITISTGEVGEGEIVDSGPAARRSVKVLIPESALTGVIGKTQDASGIFVSMLPVATDAGGKKVYGVMKIGDAPARTLKAPILQVYPLLTLLEHYRTLKGETSQGPVTVAGMQLSADQYKKYSATRVVESTSSRSTNTATLLFSDRVPTGLAGWTVTLVREEKNAGQSRDEFKKVTTISTKLNCAEIKMDAVSDLPNIK